MAADQLSGEDIKYIVAKIGAEWIRLGTRLGLDETEMTDLEHKPSVLIGTVERMIKMWEKNQGGGATRQNMIKALEDLRRNDMAHHLQKTSSRTQPKDEGDGSSSQKATLSSPPHTTVQENKQGSGIRDLEWYECNRGYCVIISNFVKDCEDEKDLIPDVKQDEQALKETFQSFGFEVNTHQDLSAKEIKSELQQLQGKDYSDYDCLVFCIGTHGDEGVVRGIDGKVVRVDEDIVRTFNADVCPTLKGKPKLFFIIACQGSSEMPGVRMSSAAGTYEYATVPIISNYLLYMESVRGYVARSSMQTFCETLNSKGDEWDIFHICTSVLGAVAQKEFPPDPKLKDRVVTKQMPTFSSTLTKLLKFNRK